VAVLLPFLLAVLPGIAVYVYSRGPRVDTNEPSGPPAPSIAEAAVLRDGAVGATRWAFAALVCRLARDGHCTLVRTRKRRWVRTVPVVTVDLHADPTILTPLEQTVLRQLGRHDTLDGFGFAGSTFRRRTLRTVRARLVERGWLADRHRRSNAFLGLGLAGLAVGLGGFAAGLSLYTVAAGAGVGVGCLVAATVRYPLTESGARRRTAHRAYAKRQRDRICAHLSEAPDSTGSLLLDALPHLVLERIATPEWLGTVADRFDDATAEPETPDWLRDDVNEISSFADGCRTLGAVLSAFVDRFP
jgi:uncharacterized protein (TIGR04222 family)